MINRIFLDLDQTLIHSLYVDKEETAENFKSWYKCFDHIDFTLNNYSEERYITFLRPSTFKLINECENLVGEENVFICTAATIEYACAINKGLGLGFPVERIYARDDLIYDCPKFEESNNILVDDHDFYFHLTNRFAPKIKFLHLKEENMIHIDEFNVMCKEDFLGQKEEEYFMNLLEQLKSRIQ